MESATEIVKGQYRQYWDLPETQRNRLHDALASLTAMQRLIWRARFMGLRRHLVDGEWRDVRVRPMSARDAGEMLDCSEDTVRVLTQRAAVRLARALG